MFFLPKKIYINEEVKSLSFTSKILKSFPEIESEVVDKDFEKTVIQRKTNKFLTEGKKFLYLTNYKGKAVKLCPAYTNGVVCCNYHVLDFIEHCPLECTYCILQSYLNHSMITFHVNVEEIVEGLVNKIQKFSKQSFRIGTGEASDSLALDHLFGLNPYLVETFSKLDNVLLELKTKTNAIEPLLGLNHNERTVVSWSINARTISKYIELKTASLDERIAAAKKLTDEGYKVAFHFDPLIHFEGWEKEYLETVDMIFDTIPADKIAWLSIGTLRYIPNLKKIVEKRFPNTPIFMNEFVPAADGKMRYIKKIRKNLISTVSQYIKKRNSKIPLYLCMENSHIWESTVGSYPETSEEMESQILKNINTSA